ncbi:MAG: hypothetical protein A2X86_07670 [Bdellovibrionales bacterium GWA2_49_15]|nr:MAG: hypothetical protein A2X86_07670 [Bdellovibrionales bacterium GWA2_49_15]HAZ11844.1 hypothetical protein [Bdellovibrionales bacterium]
MADLTPSLLIGTDFRENSKNALRTGLIWAKQMILESHVTYVHSSPVSRKALKSAHIIDQTSEEYLEASLIEKIKNQVSVLDPTGSKVQNIHYKILYGQPAIELARQATEMNPELLVLGTKERGPLGQIFLGSVTEKIIQTCTYPVLAVRDQFAIAPERITFLCDFSSISVRAWQWAKKLASVFHADLEIVHAITGKEETLQTAEKLAKKELSMMIEEDSTQKLSSVILRSYGHPKDAILDHLIQHRPHLLVMGSHGRSALKKLSLGSNADYLLSKSDCNILVVRPTI